MITPPKLKFNSLQKVSLGNTQCTIDHTRLTDISITPGPALTAFGVAPMRMRPIISVEAGNRCNCYSYENWAPHLHGTHIETREHLRINPTPVVDHIKGMAFVARLISITPERAQGLGLTLVPEGDDMIVTRDQVEIALAGDLFTPQVMIIRSPNYPGKQHKNYGGTNPPYPHHEVARLLIERGVDHLVLDFPSADREEGELLFHRTFWQDPFNQKLGKIIPELSHIPNQPRGNSAIVEMAYIPDEVKDGWYIIYLNPIGLPGDAAPLRPMIAPILDFQ